jgi:crotonobetainyl-CoA:carnitine CoA-transferase CaiB-like acyl-CoA transferase
VRYDKAPPALGQHTAEVLRDVLGLSETDIRELAALDVIGAPST